jgi:hypothetical protein
MSRPAGREALLMAKAYVFQELRETEVIALDFQEVKVLAPSWADEFISGIKAAYPNTLQYLNTENPSVEASLSAVLDE